MKFTHLQIDDFSYRVLDSTGRRCATFEYVDLPNVKPSAGCHLDLTVHPPVLDEILGDLSSSSKGFAYLFGLYRYVLDTVLDFTDKKGLQVCVIYSESHMNTLVYSELMKWLSPKRYMIEVHGHGRWIEIRQKRAPAGGKKSAAKK